MNIKSTFIRKCFAYLRLDKAMYYDKYNENNICDACNVTKDSYHILMICKTTEIERNTFLQNMNVLYPNFHNLSVYEKLISILNMQFNDLEVIQLICSFVKQICVKTKLI